jgi:CheY-like chemotaxis protein/Tfp pilus assembly protein PilZ
MNIPKILLVDDTAFFLEVEKSILSVSPVHILTATDGEHALTVIREEHPDLIIMDIVMPRLDGKKCCAQIKADPAMASIPVIMVTTSDRLEDIKACFEAGCDDFISKPLDRKRFLEKVKKFMPAIERRRFRIKCQMAVAVTFGGTSATVDCFDLSYDGMFVRSELKLSVGTEVEVSFTLPGAGGSLIKVRSHVAWVNDAGKISKSQAPTGFGIEFDEITGEGLPLIRKQELANFLDANRK